MAVLEYADDTSKLVPGTSTSLFNLPSTMVKVLKDGNGDDEVNWSKGDIPLFDNDEVVVGKPDINIVNKSSVNNSTSRETSFEASEYARLLHVLAHERMATARSSLMETRTRQQLDEESLDPWTSNITPLYNDQRLCRLGISHCEEV